MKETWANAEDIFAFMAIMLITESRRQLQEKVIACDDTVLDRDPLGLGWPSTGRM